MSDFRFEKQQKRRKNKRVLKRQMSTLRDGRRSEMRKLGGANTDYLEKTRRFLQKKPVYTQVQTYCV